MPPGSIPYHIRLASTAWGLFTLLSPSIARGQESTPPSSPQYELQDHLTSELAEQSAPWSPFLTPFDKAQNADPAQLTGGLRAIALAHARARGFYLETEVTVEHFEGEGSIPTHHRTYRIEGRITSDERLDVVETTFPKSPETDLTYPASRRITFDGKVFRVQTPEGEAGDLFDGSSTQLEALRLAHYADLEPLFRWVYDPLDLPLFDDLEVQEQRDPTTGELAITRSFQWSNGSFVGEEYRVPSTFGHLHPTRHTVYTPDGHIFSSTTYHSCRSYAPGIWRPSRITTTRYYGPSTSGKRRTVTLSILAARLLEEDEVAAVPATSDDDTRPWRVWH